MKKTLFILVANTFSILNAFAQRGFDEEYDEDQVKDMERLAHLGLTKGEIISIVVGIVLLIIAKNLEKNKKWQNGIGCLGILFSFPLIMVIIAVAQKLLGYAITLAIIIGGLYMIFGEKMKNPFK